MKLASIIFDAWKMLIFYFDKLYLIYKRNLSMIHKLLIGHFSWTHLLQHFTDEWSEITLLPKDCQLQNIMCCNYNKRLFLMVVKTKSPKGYFFTHENSEWKPVKVFLNTIIFDQISCNIMFSYNNSLFVKGNQQSNVMRVV